MFGRKSSDAENPAAAGASGGTQLANHKTLGQLLLEESLITSDQLAQALAEQESKGGFLGQILVNLGFASQEAVASALVKQCKIPHLNLLDYDVSPDVLQLLPREICERYHLLPIDKLGRILTVAMVDPLDIGALEAVRETCPELRIKPILCNWMHYEQVSRKLFDSEDGGGKRKGGANTITAESLGLRALPPEKPKESAPAAQPNQGAAAVPRPATPSGASIDSQALSAIVRESQQALAQTLQASFKELAASLQSQHPASAQSGDGGAQAPSPAAYADAMREALRDLLPAIQAGGGTPAAVAADPQAMTAAMQDSLSGAFQEALATVMVKLRAESAAQPTLEQMTEVIRASQAELAASLLEGMRTQQPAPVATAPESQSAGPDPAHMAELIRDSIAGAMQEAIATMVVQLRASGPKSSDNEAIVEALRTALASTQESQAVTSARLEQIAEAAMQSVQQAAMLVEHATTHENQDGSRLTKRNSAGSVTPFRGSGEADSEPSPEDQRVYEALESDQPQEALTFDRFVPGNANAFTAKLSQAVAANPGTDYNPFFLYGSVGLGKTHLINAIGNTILSTHQKMRVGYVSASHFARRLKESLERGAADAFRENYCCWDVLILDDIQFMGGKVEAQEEFFHIFNTLHRAGRQIIIASDKAPDKLGLLEKRLVSRFGSGIVAELKPPEWETRVEILRQYAAQQKAKVPDEILSLIAMRVPGDIRKMTGSLRKIIAYSNLVGQEMSCEAANEILSHLNTEQAA
ncbi:MAG: hypothetical protein GC168_19145 [Candidatus Hydrogenedens sp.]|nr:hypothetical protein [Candidatus Hydrogenedens sp.]